MRSYTAIIERCPDTGFYVGYVPGLPGSRSGKAAVTPLIGALVAIAYAVPEVASGRPMCPRMLLDRDQIPLHPPPTSSRCRR